MGLLHSLRTALNLASRVEDVERQLEEMQLEWVDKKDAFALLLKRLAIRESRAAAGSDGSVADPGVVVREAPEESPAASPKDRLRQLARERGLLR